MRASQEAARTKKPVKYENMQSGHVVEATPMEYNAQTKCTKIVLKQWDKGKVVGEEVKEECHGEKTTHEY